MRHQPKLQRSELWLFVMPVLTLVLLQSVITFKAWNAEHPFWATVTDPILDRLSPGRKHNGCVNGLKQLSLRMKPYPQVGATPFMQDDDSLTRHHLESTNEP